MFLRFIKTFQLAFSNDTDILGWTTVVGITARTSLPMEIVSHKRSSHRSRFGGFTNLKQGRRRFPFRKVGRWGEDFDLSSPPRLLGVWARFGLLSRIRTRIMLLSSPPTLRIQVSQAHTHTRAVVTLPRFDREQQQPSTFSHIHSEASLLVAVGKWPRKINFNKKV